ncbi:TPA: LEM-3-like GIY-YIG domain-containing protein [Pluralibacter gergoviae]
MMDILKYTKALDLAKYYVYAFYDMEDVYKRPFYIGKGKSGRCLDHIKCLDDSPKSKKIKLLIERNTLGIDILRHGMDEPTAKLVEATCIDLLGVGELTNKVRGSSSLMGRITIDELQHLLLQEETEIASVHAGLAFLLNSTYKSGMSPLELYEATRGIWAKVPKDENLNFAYATYGGLVMEVYEIQCWVKAGSQQYFTRDLNISNDTKRSEFVGRIATKEIRDLYVGKLIKKPRSHGNPFVKVGVQ